MSRSNSNRSSATIRLSALAAAALLIPSIASAADVLVESFEGNGFDYAGDPTVVTQTGATTGVTNGSFSLHVTAPQSYWIPFGYLDVNAADLTSHTLLKFDVVANTGVQFIPVFHSDPEAGNPGSGGYFQAPNGIFINASPNVQTVVYDYSGLGLPTSAAAFTLQLQGSTGNAVDYYIDNVRLGVAANVGGDGTWSANGSGDWTDPTKWKDGVIPGVPGDYAFFNTNGGAITTTNQIVVTTQQAVSLGAMFFDKGGGGYKIAGTFPVTIGTNIDVTSGSQEIAAALNFTSGGSVNIAANSNLIVRNLNVTGYGSFQKNGAGTLTVDKVTNCSVAVTDGTLTFLSGNAQNNGFIYDLNVGTTATANLGDANLLNNSLNGAGTLIIGGQLTTGQYLSSGGSPGSYFFNGTVKGAGSITIGGVDGELNNTVNFTNAVRTTGGITLNSGTMNTTSLGLGGPVAVNSGTVIVTPKAAPNDPTATSLVSSLTIAATGASVDLGNNSLVIDYSGTSPLLTVRSNLASGKLKTTSTIASGGAAALGYGEASTLGIASSFAGVSFAGGDAVLIKFTYAGDTNLDGKVDIVDLGKLAGKWQQSGMWTDGDMNYDGTVNIVDLGLLAGNWQKGVGSPLGDTADFSAALAALGLPNVSVPEPMSFGLVSLVAGSALAHRRRVAKSS